MKLSSRTQASQTDWVSAHYQTPLALGGWRKSKRDIFAATFSFLIKNIFPQIDKWRGERGGCLHTDFQLHTAELCN